MRRLAITVIFVFLFLVAARPAQAVIDSYVIEDEDGKHYQYDFGTLIESYNKNGILWRDFEERMRILGVKAVHDNKSQLYVDFPALIDAYNKGTEILQYTESPEAKTADIPELMVRVEVDAEEQLIFTDFLKSGNILAVINSAADEEELLRLLLFGAESLGISLDSYNALNDYGKKYVSGTVYRNRPPGGYGSKEAVKDIFDSATATVVEIQFNALRAVNRATDTEMMRQAILEYAPVLELDMAGFYGRTVEEQRLVLEEMLRRSPFNNVAQVGGAFASALKNVERSIIINHVNYDYTLSYAIDRQMNRNPQTDLYGGGWQTADRRLVSWFINPAHFTEETVPVAIVKSGPARLRSGPGLSYSQIDLLYVGEGPYRYIETAEDSEGYTWYRLLTRYRVGWVRDDLLTLTTVKGEGIFQFLLLSGTANADPAEVNAKILQGKGILEGKAEAFIAAARQYNVNEIYLIAHALHETASGQSELARGVEYNGRTVYNIYGIGAVDHDPVRKGAEYAYKQGWFTLEDAIIGGAAFVAENYINNPLYRQDTLYKMRWNPVSPGDHQYATDVGWAEKQVKYIKSLYDLLSTYILRLEIPRYR